MQVRAPAAVAEHAVDDERQPPALLRLAVLALADVEWNVVHHQRPARPLRLRIVLRQDRREHLDQSSTSCGWVV